MTDHALPDVLTLRSAIQMEYQSVAQEPAKGFHFLTGRPLAERLGYPLEDVDALPDAIIESFAGVGNPFFWGDPAPGSRVVDLGSGAGFDALQAAVMVGPSGSVTGIDMTPAMIGKAQDNARLLGADNAKFVQAFLEDMPLDDNSVDLVISNGVLNLCLDKRAVLAEAYRVLAPGGRLQISDIVVTHAVPDEAKTDISLWTG